jgi:phosphoserine phosphatase RsbU/P
MSRLTRYLPARFFNRSLQRLVRELPVRSLLPLAGAIFCLFAVLGPVVDVLGGGTLSTRAVLWHALASGLFSIGYAFGSLRRNWYLFNATVASQLLWVFAIRGPGALAMPAPSPVRHELVFDGLATIVLMTGSYTCFLWFINVTAARYLRVRAEMDLAHEIHQVLVPAIERHASGFEFLGLSSPSGEVGGDLVDVVDIPAAAGAPVGWVGYIADVSGHGVSSGVVMGMFKSALRMRLGQPGNLDALLTDLNRVIYPLKSTAMYITAACVRGGTGGRLEFAVAGHLPILRVRDGRVDEITTPQVPVGMFDDYRFVSASIDCAPGDLLALVTDGLTEVFDARDRELGLEAVKQILTSAAGRPLADIAGAIVAKARAHGTQLDDQTLLLVRHL